MWIVFSPFCLQIVFSWNALHFNNLHPLLCRFKLVWLFLVEHFSVVWQLYISVIYIAVSHTIKISSFVCRLLLFYFFANFLMFVSMQFPKYPLTRPWSPEKEERSSLNADIKCTSTSHEVNGVSKTSNSSETNTLTSPESDTNDWGLDDLLGSEFNWDLDNNELDPFVNFESQTTTSDETDQSAVLDVATSHRRVQRSKLQDVSGQIINKNAIAARIKPFKEERIRQWPGAESWFFDNRKSCSQTGKRQSQQESGRVGEWN